MLLAVGLGNPGKEFERSRHNAGFWAVEALQKHFRFPPFLLKKNFQADISEGEYGEQKIILVKPQTYMNLSGESVGKLMNYYKVPLTNIWVFYDDIDLPLGEVRIREKGSAGTHNGMRSVIAHLGSGAFPRIRLGVGEGSLGFGKKDLKDWILSPIPKKEKAIFRKMAEIASGGFKMGIGKGIQAAMSSCNKK